MATGDDSRRAHWLGKHMRGERVPGALLLAFLGVWVALAIAPNYRSDWLLENTLVFVGVPALAWGYRRLRLSNSSYLLVFAFLVLHEIGAHYTYAEVPYDRWIRTLTGASLDQALGFSRNHYDRLVHFLYGLLLTPAIGELVQARSRPTPGLWRAFLPWSVVLASSAFFELVEWAAAVLFGGPLGVAYLGTQGDVWDAQQDMLLAGLGSLLAVLLGAGKRAARVPGKRPA